MRERTLLLSIPLLAALSWGCTAEVERPEISQLLALPNARVPVEGMLVGGQPSIDQLERAAAAGYRVVVDLRAVGEPGAIEDERALVTGLGMSYVHIPVAGREDISEENARRLDQELDRLAGPVLFHCASGNRVGALLAVRAALDGMSPEDALAFGKNAGLTSLEPHTRTVLGL